MELTSMLSSALPLVFGSMTAPQPPTAMPSTLNVTAVTAANGESVLQCWQLGPLASAAWPGTIGTAGLFMGRLANATFSIIPPRYDGGWHNAPARQWFFLATGILHVTLPNSTDEIYVTGGKNGLLIAEDTPEVSKHGHGSQFPTDGISVGLQIPIQDGTDFDHVKLHDGPCSDMAGW